MTIQILHQLGNETNQSVRLAMAKARKKNQPRNQKLWGQVHAWVMEILKYQLTINYIQQIILPHDIKGHIKPYIDLVTYWQYWGRRKPSKIKQEIIFLLKTDEVRQPKWLITYIEEINKITLRDLSEQIVADDKRWSFEYSLPVFMHKALKPVYNTKELDLLGSWFNKPQPKYFWVNSLLEKNPEQLVDKLSASIKFSSISSVSNVYKLKKGQIATLRTSGSFNQGKLIIQDIAASLVHTFLPLKPDHKIVDACAAPGNKTVQLLARESNIDLWAGDLEGSRFNLLKERVNFLTPSSSNLSYHLKAWDARNLPFKEKSIDAIMIDAPCTGTGTFGTKPDLRKITFESAVSHALLQKAILSEASRVIKVKGFILYATCSILTQENEEVIETFLTKSKNYNWKIKPIYHPFGTESLLEGALRFFPPDCHSEGFFACLLERIN